MTLQQLQPGDMLYAESDITNDGSIPDMPEGEIIAPRGRRGVLVNTGHLEENEAQQVFLVRFENAQSELLPPVGCWPQELSAQPAGD